MAMRVVAINHFIVMPTFSTAWWRCGCCREKNDISSSSSDNGGSFLDQGRTNNNFKNDSRMRQRRRSANEKSGVRRHRAESESIRLTLPQERPQSKLLENNNNTSES